MVTFCFSFSVFAVRSPEALTSALGQTGLALWRSPHRTFCSRNRGLNTISTTKVREEINAFWCCQLKMDWKLKNSRKVILLDVYQDDKKLRPINWDWPIHIFRYHFCASLSIHKCVSSESPGLVMGGDSCAKGGEFKSWHCILYGHFFTFICTITLLSTACLAASESNLDPVVHLHSLTQNSNAPRPW